MGALAVRLARAQDFRRRLHEKASSWPIRIKRVSFSSVPSLGEGDIPLLSPLSVLCGPNGVGKTTLLRLLWSVLDPDAAKKKPLGFARLKSGTATVEVAGPDNSFEFGLDFGSQEASASSSRDELELEIAYIDTANEGPRIQSEFSNSDSPEDIINGAGAIELDPEQLTEINFLTMRNYRQINLYEVELGEDVVPFFEVAFGPDRYDSRSMGSGEFSAFFLWWRLQRATPKLSCTRFC
ncbi:AAA family ATPase [Bradyrhizobium sp. 38]|uniref:AAA family ATPase n=1 Tax=unclassified Bradyrhizobium TaxID=2631580 RepID=UPI001FF78724|nr:MULTISPECIES: AAA family ATPase [unclassified Bradyrhizobium]MCK1339727.1 AAA family ATPase [Bradyrhizobium sp. 38]